MRTILTSFLSLALCASAASAQAPGVLPGARPMRSAPGGSIPGVVAVIGAIEGIAQVRSSPTQEWRSAEEGQALPAGSELRTLSTASLTLAFSNGSKLRLGPNANFKLEAASPSRISVFMSLGRLEGWIKGLRGGTFRARTPVAVASVRGTVFVMSVISATQMSLDLFSGSLDLADNFGGVSAVQPGYHVEASAANGVTGVDALPAGSKGPAEPEVSIPGVPTGAAAGGEASAAAPPADEVPATGTEGEGALPPPTPAQEASTTCDPTVSPAVVCP